MRMMHRGKPIVRAKYVADGDTYDPRPAIASNDPTEGYAFIWPFKEAPVLGAWAETDTGKRVVVVGFGTNYKGSLVALVKSLPGNAVAEAEARDVARVEDGRRALEGRRVTGVPPVDGPASASKAADFGKWWWRTWKVAQRQGVPDAERFEHVARRWYAIRDAGGTSERRDSPAQPSAGGGLRAAVRGLFGRR